MLAHIPIGRCCSRPRFNAVGGFDERARPWRLGPALRRKLRSIAGDRAAAERVELALPETGASNRSAVLDANECCGGLHYPMLTAVASRMQMPGSKARRDATAPPEAFLNPDRTRVIVFR